MARVKGPFMSLGASGSFTDKLTCRNDSKGAVIVKRSKPGSANPLTISQAQLDHRAIYGSAVEAWRSLSVGEKDSYSALAAPENISGWNYFVRDYINNYSPGPELFAGRDHHVTITIPASEVSGASDITDYRLLLDANVFNQAPLNGSIIDADGASPMQTDGGDLYFSTDSLGTNRLSCEVVYVSLDNNPANSKLLVYVLIPSLSVSVDTVIWLHWGSGTSQSQPAVNAAYGRNSVWETDYLCVYHCATPSGTLLSDSSGNMADLTVDGSFTVTEGPSFYAAVWAGADEALIGPEILPHEMLLTRQIWSYRTGDGVNGFGHFWTEGEGNSRFANFSAGNSDLLAPLYAGGFTLVNWDRKPANEWHKSVIVHDDTLSTNVPIMYRDGAFQAINGATYNTGARSDAYEVFAIGNWASLENGYEGYLAHFRVYNGALSADYAATEYNNETASDSFAVVGSQL